MLQAEVEVEILVCASTAAKLELQAHTHERNISNGGFRYGSHKTKTNLQTS